MVEHPASTRVVDDVPTRVAAAPDRLTGKDFKIDLADPSTFSNGMNITLAGAELPVRDRGFNPGGRTDVLPMSIVNGSEVIAGSDKTPLSSNVLDAAKVQNKQGYFQAAERMLGGEFSHNEKRQFTDALKKNWTSEHPGVSSLNKGDALLTDKNKDAVLNNIADPALRQKIGDRLSKGLPEEGSVPKLGPAVDRPMIDRPAVEPQKGRVKPADEIPVPQRRPEERLPAGDLDKVPDGPVKSPYLKQYDVGDRFTGMTSIYGSGRLTASGLPFKSEQMVAASREFPFGTVLSVTNPATGIEKKVVVTDNGPFANKKVDRNDGSGERTYNRVVDLSTGAARALGNFNLGDLQYKVMYIPPNGAWGKERQNIHGDYKQEVRENVLKYSRR